MKKNNKKNLPLPESIQVVVANWIQIQHDVYDGVVEVFSQVAAFNWLEPYKSPDQEMKTGSGFIVTELGEIITNYHVVDEAKRIWVSIPSLGKKKIEVLLKSFCPSLDIALLQIADFKDLPDDFKLTHLPLGDSDAVFKTDEVMALGYPLGQENLKSVTGIISGREFLNPLPVLQTTAPLNPGNSGGPLFNTKGEVVGINTSAVPAAENVGYALAINDLKIVWPQLQRDKIVRKTLLGVSFNEVNDVFTNYLGNPVPGGIYVNTVYRFSLADTLGIKPGDMIYEINGHVFDVFGYTSIEKREDRIILGEFLRQFIKGNSVKIILYRRGEKVILNGVFDDPPLYPVRVLYPDFEPVDYEVIAGLVVMPLCINNLFALEEAAEGLAKYRHIENHSEPLLVITNVLLGSEVSRYESIFPGDIIDEINGVKVKTLEEFRKALFTGIKDDILLIKTADNVVFGFSLMRVLKDDIRLSTQFRFPLSSTGIELMKKMGILNEVINGEGHE